MHLAPFRARPVRVLGVLAVLLLILVRLSDLLDVPLREGLVTGYRKTHDALTSTDAAAIDAPVAITAPATPKSRIAKVTIATNKLETDIIRRALQTHERHNARHGYTQFTATRQAVGSLTENDRHKRPKGAWTKPAYLLSILVAELQKPQDERLEWVFWFDADTVILNPSTPLETFLPPRHLQALRTVNLLITSNWDGHNSGVFALRVSPWSVSFLSAILAYPIYEADRTQRDRFRDQAAFQFLLVHPDSPLVRHAPGGMGGREWWATVPIRWFNSLPVNNAFRKDGTWLFAKEMGEELFDRGTSEVYNDGNGGEVKPWKVMRGDLAVHFAGTDRVRESWMGPWVDRADAMEPEWDNATATEVLRGEVVEFWQKEDTKMQIEKDRAEKEAREREVERKEKEAQKKKQEAADKEAERQEKEKEAERQREEERQKEREKSAKEMAEKLRVYENDEDGKKGDEDKNEEAAKQEESARLEDAAKQEEQTRLEEAANQEEAEQTSDEPDQHAELEEDAEPGEA
ncbi:galactosyl transferase [Podospora conica]|nr:galactosyl transferase [Schizothecium conicum]